MLSQRTILTSGAVAGVLAVALGAFGAHALRPTLELAGHVATYEVGVRYHLYHALVLLLIGVLIPHHPKKSTLSWAAGFILVGIILFSGSLYVLALTSLRAFAFLTPVGGAFFLTGWGLMVAAFVSPPPR